MITIRFSKRAIGFIRRLNSSDIFLHPAFIYDTKEGKEETGYAAIAWGDNGKKWPVVVLWGNCEKMTFPGGYKMIQVADDIPYDREEAVQKLMQLRDAWRYI